MSTIEFIRKHGKPFGQDTYDELLRGYALTLLDCPLKKQLQLGFFDNDPDTLFLWLYGRSPDNPSENLRLLIQRDVPPANLSQLIRVFNSKFDQGVDSEVA